MHEIREFIKIIEDGGIIAILIMIIYYGHKQIEKLDNSIKNQLQELTSSWKEIQKETNEILKDSIRVIAKNNDVEVRIQEAINSCKKILYKFDK